MLTIIGQAVGVVTMLGLCLVGANTLAKKIFSWKRAYESY